MSTIKIAEMILVIAGVFCIRRIALRQSPRVEPPERTELTRLRAQVWIGVICMVLFFVFMGVMYAKGVAWPPAFSLFVFAVIAAVLIGMIFRFRRYKKSLDKHDG